MELIHTCSSPFAMASAASRSPSEGASAPPIFSYAQAAKGRTASASNLRPSQTTSGVSTPPKEVDSMSNTPSASLSGAAGSDIAEKATNGISTSESRADEAEESKVASAANVSSVPTSPNFGTASVVTLADDELSLSHRGTPESVWDRHNSAAYQNDKTSEVSESRRNKKSKKQKNTDKEAEVEKEEVKQEVLVPATVPSVNIWQQRAQAAKAKPTSPKVQSPQTVPEVSGPNEAVNLQIPKAGEGKRRAKSTSGDDGEKSSNAVQNEGPKEMPSVNKGQKKSSDGTSKGKEEMSSKRAPRGSRTGDKEDKPVASQAPPPVEDAISWPTPETALEEEKRKVQVKTEFEEKDETAPTKPRQKEKWVTVPFTPTVTFNTPLPTRGGRGRGGSRASRDAGSRNGQTGNGSSTVEKAQHASATSANTGGDNRDPRGKDDARPGRAASLPPNSTKRPSSDGTKEPRKPSTAGVSERSKVASTNGPARNGTGTASEARRASVSAATQTELPVERHQDQVVHADQRGPKADQARTMSSEVHARSSSRAADRRSEPNIRGLEQFKDTSNGQAREPRPDRGRGAFRGRGGHNVFAAGQQPHHAFTNGQGVQSQTVYPVRPNAGPYSPPLHPPPFQNPYAQGHSRGGRVGSRSQSIPNTSMFGRFPTNAGPAPSQMAPLQTSTQMFDYPGMQSTSAVPYNPYIDQYSVLAMVTMQLEYYFSIDNLCKDVYLRKHMDSQGFVFLSFIAGFKRIQALTQDFELLRFACQESGSIDIIRGEDGIDRLRREEGWEQWILPVDERDESVRNAGPSYHHRQPKPQQQMPQMIFAGQHAMSPPAFSPNGTESSFHTQLNGTGAAPAANGNGHNYHPETPLSAAVPDFAPGLLPLDGVSEDPLEAETTFTDEEVLSLTLVFASPKTAGDTKPTSPFRSASSRTFSNGSIDGRSIAEETHDDRQGRTLTNGSRTEM